MDKNTITGIIIIFILIIGYAWWSSPSKEEQAERQRIHDSITKANHYRDSVLYVHELEKQLKEAKDSIIEPIDAINQQAISLQEDSLVKTQSRSRLGAFANASEGEEKSYLLENDLIKLYISSKGGRVTSVELKEYKTYDTLPLILFEKNSSKFNLSFFSNNRPINTKDLYFKPYWKDSRFEDKDSVVVNGSDSVSFIMRLHPVINDSMYDKNRYIEYVYTMKGDEYMIGYTVNFSGMEDVIAGSADYINLEWDADLLKQEKVVNRFNGPTIYYKYYKDDVDYLSETKDDNESLKSSVKWISYKQPFFSSILIAKNSFNNAEIETYTNPDKENNEHYLKTMKSVIGIPFSSAPFQSIPMSFYFGPNKYRVFRAYNLELERQIPLGLSFAPMAWINRFAVIPVFNYLETFNWNYGIIILVLTILLKIVLFPIAYKTYKSSAKMRVLKPEIDVIAKKFPKKEQSMDKQKATMALYKKAGVNPMAGCVPMLLQMPILFAMFRFFPASIELRQQSFLWAHDLSSYDSIWTFPNGFEIPFYGDHVSLFTLLMTVSTIFYTRINNQMMSSSQQMPGMKTMMYLMPIMFLGMFNNYSSGLSYYYFLANVITFGQMFLIRRTINEEKILAKIQEQKKKPVNKSSFQKRLEDMAKKRGYDAKKGKR